MHCNYTCLNTFYIGGNMCHLFDVLNNLLVAQGAAPSKTILIYEIYKRTLNKNVMFTTGVGNHQMQAYQFIKSQYFVTLPTYVMSYLRILPNPVFENLLGLLDNEREKN